MNQLNQDQWIECLTKADKIIIEDGRIGFYVTEFKDTMMNIFLVGQCCGMYEEAVNRQSYDAAIDGNSVDKSDWNAVFTEIINCNPSYRADRYDQIPFKNLLIHRPMIRAVTDQIDQLWSVYHQISKDVKASNWKAAVKSYRQGRTLLNDFPPQFHQLIKRLNDRPICQPPIDSSAIIPSIGHRKNQKELESADFRGLMNDADDLPPPKYQPIEAVETVSTDRQIPIRYVTAGNRLIIDDGRTATAEFCNDILQLGYISGRLLEQGFYTGENKPFERLRQLVINLKRKYPDFMVGNWFYFDSDGLPTIYCHRSLTSRYLGGYQCRAFEPSAELTDEELVEKAVASESCEKLFPAAQFTKYGVDDRSRGVKMRSMLKYLGDSPKAAEFL